MRTFGWALIAAGLGLAAIYGLQRGVGLALLGLAVEPATVIAAARAPAPVPAERPFRLLLLGTSLSAQGQWPRELERRLSACRPGGVALERLARSGANSAWGASALAARLGAGAADRPPPDLILAEFSINDTSLWRGMRLAQSRARHDEILATAGQVPVWLVTMSPAFGRDAWERPGQVAYRALYADLARERGAGVIPTIAPWLALPPAERRISMPDNLHPTDAAVIALTVPLLEQALRPVICPD